MKITEVETIALRDPDAVGFGDLCVVRVHTDEDVTGIGQVESPSLVVEAIVKARSGLAGIIRDEDPT
jgi:L-rhamnonate dehydratase